MFLREIRADVAPDTRRWHKGDMDVELIKDGDPLHTWLKDKPIDWAQIIAVRAALQALPYLSNASEKSLSLITHLLFRALTISWAARNMPAHDMTDAADAARIVRAVDAAYDAANDAADAAAYAAGLAWAFHAAAFAGSFYFHTPIICILEDLNQSAIFARSPPENRHRCSITVYTSPEP